MLQNIFNCFHFDIFKLVQTKNDFHVGSLGNIHFLFLDIEQIGSTIFMNLIIFFPHKLKIDQKGIYNEFLSIIQAFSSCFCLIFWEIWWKMS